MLSYWEKQSFTRYDHIVVGSGLVGLSLSIELSERYPGKRILVLERGLLPSGASTRNAGFACMGSVTELLDDLQTSNAEEVVTLFAERQQGLELLRRRLGDSNVGYEDSGSYELIGPAETYALDHIDTLNELLRPVTNGVSAFGLAGAQVQKFRFDAGHCVALIRNNLEGALNTGKMMQSLYRMAQQRGVEIKTGARVNAVKQTDAGADVIVADDVRGEVCFKAGTASICTNAFAGSLLPNEDVVPGRGNVLLTSPIAHLPFKGIFHFDKGYYYFREIDGRILFGGGRNMDPEGEATTQMTLNTAIQNDLEAKLRNIIIPGVEFTIDSRWSGIMAFGKDKRPIVKQLSPAIFGAFRMGGMGIALGSMAARKLADIIASEY